MSKKHWVSQEALGKVNGGYILDDRNYVWHKPAGVTGRFWNNREGYTKGEQIGGSIKLINEQGKIVEEFQDMDKALAREKELGIKSGSIDQNKLYFLKGDSSLSY